MAVSTAIVGAGAGIYAGNKAASAQRRAAADANARLASGQRNAINQLQPYSEYGRQAFSPLSAMLFGKEYNADTGEFGRELSQQERLGYFQESPGYQYQLDQGIGAIDRSAASQGMLQSGNTMKEVQQYGQNLANQEYGNYIDSLLGQLGYAQQADVNIANTISGNATNMANYSYAGGMANAAKYSNLSNFAFQTAGQGFQAMLGNGGQSGGGQGGGSPFAALFSGAGSGGAAAASDINLKENIIKIGEEKGFNIYEFNYKGQPEKYQGVMAQEVQKVMPEAVIEQDGHLAVLYDKIGIEFKKL
jgi:hypothetical protein